MRNPVIKTSLESLGPLNLLTKGPGLTVFFGLFAVLVLALIPSPSAAQNFYSKDAFEILGVKKTDPIETIKDQYRLLAKKHYPKAPDRLKPEDLAEATRIFGLVKAAYEAIDQLDERIIRGAIEGGTLGLNKKEFLMRGGSPARADAIYGAQSFNDSDGYESQTSADQKWSESFFSDLHQRSKNAKSGKPQSKVRDVKTYAGIFPGEIKHIYGNASGVIIEAHLFEDGGGRVHLYWIPSDSNIIYPVIFTDGGISGWTEEDRGTFFDPRLPEGSARLIHRPGIDIKTRSHTFKSLPVFDSAQINEKLALGGYRVFDNWKGKYRPNLGLFETPVKGNLNLFTYYIFSDGQYYIVIRETEDEKYYPVISAFEGYPGNMVPNGLILDRERRALRVPGRKQIWQIGNKIQSHPIFDEHLGLYLGNFAQTSVELSIFEESPNNRAPRLIRKIPAISIEQVPEHNFNFLLGKYLQVPLEIRTPLDREFLFASAEKQASSAPLQIAGRSNVDTANLATAKSSPTVFNPQPNSSSPDSSDVVKAGPSNFQRIQDLKRRFRKIADFLDDPQGDVRQLVAKYLLSGQIRLEEISAIIDRHGANPDVMTLMLLFTEQLQNWDVLKRFLFIFHRNIDFHISRQAQMQVMAMIHLRDLILRVPNPQDPAIMSIVERLRIPYPQLMSYIEAAWAKRWQGYLPPPPAERLTVEQEWLAISGCQGLLE